MIRSIVIGAASFGFTILLILASSAPATAAIAA